MTHLITPRISMKMINIKSVTVILVKSLKLILVQSSNQVIKANQGQSMINQKTKIKYVIIELHFEL